jgi:hypothetical protein
MIEKAEYPNFHTFAEAVEYLSQGNWIDYEVKIDGHSGALMTREEWLEAVESGSFIDYDGMGDQVTADGKIVKFERDLRENYNVGGWIYPSEALRILPETKYILWYNK